MSLRRCSKCKVLTLVEEDLRSGLCPECGTPLPGSSTAAQQPVAARDTERRGRGGWWFVLGLFLGVLAAGSGAAAWWFWGRQVGGPPPVQTVSVQGDAAPELASPDERLQHALSVAELAECRRSAAEGELADAVARSRSDAAALEQELATSRQKLEQARELAAAARKTLEDKQADAAGERVAAQARRQELEAQMAAARDRLQQAKDQAAAADRALEAKKAQLAAAERAFEAKKGEQNNRAADADRQMAAAQTRLREARDQSAAADRTLEGKKAQLAAAERALEAKKNEVAALDRALEAKRGQVAAAERALEAKKTETAAADKALEARRAQLAAISPSQRFGEPMIRSTADVKKIDAAFTTAPKQGQLPAPHAFVRQWRVVGPFPNEDRKKGHVTVYPPEKEPVTLTKDYATTKGQARWHTFASPGDYIDLANYFNGQPTRKEIGQCDQGVAYAVCWVRSDYARPALISLGSNDGIKLWLNRREYLDKAIDRAASPDQERVPCELSAGWNEVLLKVDNQGGGWGFYLEFRETNGSRPLEGLEYRTRPPEGAARK